MKKTALIAVILSALLSLSIGCGGGSNPTGDVDPGAWAYAETQMVVSKLYLPLTSQDANNFAFDLDHNGMTDNQLGKILVALKSSMGSTDPQSTVDDQMNAGNVILLFGIYAESMQLSKKANLWAFLGQSMVFDPPTGPQAGDTFSVDTATGPTNAYFGGSIKNGGGTFGGENATLTINLPLASSNLELTMQAVNMDFDVSSTCTPTSCEFTNGRLGGAVTETDLNAKVLPEVANLLQGQVANYCTMTGTPAACTCSSDTNPDGASAASTIVGMFDTDGSCEITVDEVQTNNIIQAFLKPDVTLPDGTKALSLSVGFDAVNAAFTHDLPPQ
jgi:hypothetical protein